METPLDFAVAAHGAQKYGDKPYSIHLRHVVSLLRKVSCSDKTIVAGYLHDILEDTPISFKTLEEQYGSDVAQDVWACTGVGANRKERNASIYAKLAKRPSAIPVKLADRLANVMTSKDSSPRHFSMYKSEYQEFRTAILKADPDVLSKPWGQLLMSLDELFD